MSARALVFAVSILVAAVSTAARASDFEFCELEGEVLSATRDRSSGPGAYQVEVQVDDAAESRGERGYTDCREYMGLTVDAVVVFPRAKTPKPGMVLRFQRTAVDGVDTQGEHITSVRTRFRSLRVAPADGLRQDGE